MRATDDLVREFHEATGQEIADSPIIPSKALVRHRLRLLEEEWKEVSEELHVLLQGDLSIDDALATLGRLLKELCDLRYVADGTCVSLGLPYEEAYRAVHASNMTKTFPAGEKRFFQAKVPKGPNYRPPDMTRFVQPIIEGEIS